MDISVIVPLYNEAESLPELNAWIRKVMEDNHFSYEVIYVDDGSNDNSWDEIHKLAAEDTEHVKAASLWQITGSEHRLQARSRRCRNHHGRRPAGQPGRNSRALPHD